MNEKTFSPDDPFDIEQKYYRDIEEITSYLEDLLENEGLKEKYWAYFNHGLGKIAKLLYNLSSPEGYKKEKIEPVLEKVLNSRVLDFGGGRVSSNNESKTSKLDRIISRESVSYDFYPWFSTALGTLQRNLNIKNPVKPICVDLPNEKESSSMDAEDIQQIEALFQAEDFDLASLLKVETTDEEFNKKLSILKEMIGKEVEIINCQMLVSLNPDSPETTSPHFARELGFKTWADGLPIIESDEEKQRWRIVFLRLVEVFSSLIQEGGFLYWNDLLYKKLGDRFVWIPNYHSEIGKVAWRETLKNDGKGWSVGDVVMSNWHAWKIESDGSIVKDHNYPDISEPIP